MNPGLSMRESPSSSRPARPTAPLPFNLRDSQDAPRLRWQQLAADRVEVRQREQAEGARQVLRDAAVADLGESPQPLDHMEWVLAAGTGPRPRPIDGAPARGQRPVGAGAAGSSVDAANILKPALSRGELQVIGATTLDEYRKYIESDAALERRFQPIMVDEPTIDETIENLRAAVALHLDGEDPADFGLRECPTLLVTIEVQPSYAKAS